MKNLFIDPKTDQPKKIDVQEIDNIDGHSIGYQQPIWPKNGPTYQELKDKGHIEISFIDTLEGTIPVIYWDNYTPQYFSVVIDGYSSRDLKYIEITTRFQCFRQTLNGQYWEDLAGNIYLHDGHIRGQGSGRALFEIKEKQSYKYDSPEAFDAMVKLKQKLFAQLSTITDFESQYEKANKKTEERESILKDVLQELNREQYEYWCNQLGIEPDQDDGIYSYKHYDYGVGEFDHLTVKEQLRQILIIRHGAFNHKAKQNQIKTNQPVSIPKPNGQLWQACKCGREPVYLPLELCEKCWPK